MKRDFTRETIADLYETMRECVEEEEQFRVFDYFEDLFAEDLEIGDYINDIKAYHEHMFDKHNMNAQILDAILQRVDETERSYAGKLAGCRMMLTAFEQRVSKVCEMIDPDKLAMSEENYARQMRWITDTYKIKKSIAARMARDGEQALIDMKQTERDKICAWLATDYKMTEEELAEAAVILSRYFEPGTNQYDSHYATESYSASFARSMMSDEELQEYQLMCALYNKCDTLSSFQTGFLSLVPFFTLIMEGVEYITGEKENPYSDLVSYQVQIENSHMQHPIATFCGEMSMYLLELCAATAFAEGAEPATGGAGAMDDAVEEAIERNMDDVADAALKSGTNSIPENARNIAQQIENNNGAPPIGYKGGKVYQNNPINGEQQLPEGINYREYDVNPYVKGQGRGTERIVIGDDGSVWYTNDHYQTFQRME